MIRVVLDTNVLVSALLFVNGPRWWWPRCGRCRACIGLGEDGSTYLASNLLDPVARAQQPVVERVQAPQAEAFVSQASLWEMEIKDSIGRLQVDLPELERQVPLQGFRWLPISNAHLLAVADLGTDGIHLDPWRPAMPFMARPPDSGALAEPQAENPLRVGGD